MAVRESAIEAHLCRLVKAMGGRCDKWVSPGCRGVPDRIVILPNGRVFFVEVKAPTGTNRPWQKRYQQNLTRLGCSVAVLYTRQSVTDWVDAIKENEKAL